MFCKNYPCAWVLSEAPKDSSCFCKWLIVNYFKRSQMAMGWKMTRQIPIFPPHSAFIPLPSLSRHSFSGEVVSHPTVNGIVACKDSVKPGTPQLNYIDRKRLYNNTLSECNQKSLFPAKSTWMPLGTRIICCIFVRYCESMNYTGVTKIDLFPVLPKLSAGPLKFSSSLLCKK